MKAQTSIKGKTAVRGLRRASAGGKGRRIPRNKSGQLDVPEAPGIYLMWNECTGQVMVGMTTKSLRNRINQQVQALRRGGTQNHLVSATVRSHGAETFRFSVLEICPKQPEVRGHTGLLLRRELWWAERLGALDERKGFNLAAGHSWSAAARLRDTERKLMKAGSPKYVLLPGVSLENPFNPEFLLSWQRGMNDHRM